MKFNQPIIPVALDAFCDAVGSYGVNIHMAAGELLDDKSNWSDESGSELEESVYQAAFVLRWGDDIDSEIYERIVKMLEPYREDEISEWLQ